MSSRLGSSIGIGMRTGILTSSLILMDGRRFRCRPLTSFPSRFPTPVETSSAVRIHPGGIARAGQVEGQLRGPLNVPQAGIQCGGGEMGSLFLEAGANRDDRHRHSSRVIHIHLRVQVGVSLKREEMKALQVAIPTR